jgi:hypothetical protein
MLFHVQPSPFLFRVQPATGPDHFKHLAFLELSVVSPSKTRSIAFGILLIQLFGVALSLYFVRRGGPALWVALGTVFMGMISNLFLAAKKSDPST